MSSRRLTAAMLLGIGLASVLSGSALCQDVPPLPRAEAGDALNKEAPPPDFPPGPGPQGPMRRHRQAASPPGPPAAMPNRPGRFDPRGPRGPMHPAGPPRWPFHNWDALERTDPEMYKLLTEDYELERRTRELAIQYRRASGERRAEIREQLKESVDKHFQVRQERRLLELKRLEEELQRLREAIQRRDESRKTLVGERVLELLGDENDLDF